MKIYTSKPDEYGWYLRICLRKDGIITLEYKRIDGKYKDYWHWLQTPLKELNKGLKFLKKRMRYRDEDTDKLKDLKKEADEK